MPLQKLEFRPGVNRESTTLANEGGWFESNKVRWRSGYPEKIGGWTKDTGTENVTSPASTFSSGGLVTALQPTTGSFWGVCRTLFNWLNLSGYNLMAIGTNLKYYIQNGSGGNYYDITPIRETALTVGNAFTTNTSTNTGTQTTLVVNDPGHGAQTGDFVSITGTSGPVNGVLAADINGEHQITFISTTTYSIVVNGTASSSGTPAVSANFYYQITTGSDIYTTDVGWGAGGWGGSTTGYSTTGWGVSAPAGLGIGVQLRLWSQANFGQDLIFNPRGGALYYWAVDSNPNVYNRGQLMQAGGTITVRGSSVAIDSSCPSLVNTVGVSDASRFVIAFGCNDPSGVLFSTAQDPLLIRWSDQENYADWTPSTTNQAGDYRLSQGSQIITALQARQEILVWTDAALYSMQYLGPPYVWGFQIMGSNISIVSPNAVATANNVTYWMGTDKFYMYSGRVETLPCTLRQYVFDDINIQQAYQFFAGTNEGYNEIWWFYCSANSTVVDRYIIFNHLERTWYYGTMERTAWLDTPLRDFPSAAGYNGQLIYHESGVDDGTTNPPSPIEAYCQSSDFDIGDGHNFGMVWRIIPDVTFDGSAVNNPSVTFTVRPRQNPGANYGSTDYPDVVSAQNYQNQQTYNVQQFTQYAYVRIRGRQMAFKISSSDVGVSWQLGSPRLDVRPDGRR
jgi:hypothetical protein